MADHTHHILAMLLIWMYSISTWISCVTATGEPQRQVVGSNQAVLAKVGDDVTLPCHIKPYVNASKKTVEWTRPDLDPPYVNLLQQGHIQSHPLNLLYSQRAFLFDEELSHGNISLKIFRVQLEGAFQCYVPNLNSDSDRTTIQLFVGAVSQPVISSAGPKDHGWSLTCDSGCWYPEPEVSWLDSEGNNITADSSVMDRDPQNCYAVQSNVTVRRTGNVTCRVHLTHINHTVETQHVISELRVLMIPAEGGLTAGAIAGITIGGLVAALVAALAIWGCICWNKEAAICWGAQKAQKNSVEVSFSLTNSKNGDHTLTEPLTEEGTQVSYNTEAHSSQHLFDFKEKSRLHPTAEDV